MNHEQVRKAHDRRAQVGVEALIPLLHEAHAAASFGVELQHRAAHGIEACREHQDVDFVLAFSGSNTRWRERLDGIFTQVDQGHVLAVVGFEVAVIEDEALGPEIVVGHQFSGGLGIANGLADLVADELGDLVVEILVDQDTDIAIDGEMNASLVPEPLVQRAALCG